MSRNYVILAVLVLCSIVACNGSLHSHITGGYKSFETKNSSYEIDCSQFSSDHDILRQLPFPIFIRKDTTDQEWNESTAITDDTGTFVQVIYFQAQNVIPSSVYCLSNLERLHSTGTPFHNNILPDALANLKQLREIWVYDVLIVNITEKLATLSNFTTLVLSNCSLTRLPNLSGLTKLEHLGLTRNRLSHLEGMPDLLLLILADNLFVEMPAIKNKDKLLYFDMSNNSLKIIPPISSFINLIGFKLSNTTITSIPANIDKLQKLEFAHLSYNKLSTLPANIFKLPKLEDLDISNNLFSSSELQSIQNKFKKYRPETQLVV